MICFIALYSAIQLVKILITFPQYALAFLTKKSLKPKTVIVFLITESYKGDAIRGEMTHSVFHSRVETLSPARESL